jgi:hypothetical protein
MTRRPVVRKLSARSSADTVPAAYTTSAGLSADSTRARARPLPPPPEGTER